MSNIGDEVHVEGSSCMLRTAVRRGKAVASQWRCLQSCTDCLVKHKSSRGLGNAGRVTCAQRMTIVEAANMVHGCATVL